MRRLAVVGLVGLALWLAGGGPAEAQQPQGKIQGSELSPSPDNLARSWAGASLVLPPALTGGALWQGALRDAPSAIGAAAAARSPLVILMHGSSGLAPFVGEHQRWLAERLGLPSIAPDSLAIPNRLTYSSPIDVAVYERVHSLRLAELEHALTQAKALPWVDPARILIAGTSEGAVPVARLSDPQPLARLIYSWSCEANYFVEAPKTAVPTDTPVLSVIATRDPYFSPENPWNASYAVKGTCGEALKAHRDATIIALSSDKHTILNSPQSRDAAAAFITRVLGR